MRAAITALAATIAFAFTTAYGQLRRTQGDPDQGIPADIATDTEKLIAIIGALLVLATGVLTVRAMGGAIKSMADEPGEVRRTAPLVLLVSAIGYLFVLFAVLGALEVPVGKVLLGGALTGVILGIAAQQSLGNFFAGIVLLAIRPFSVGDRLFLKSGPLGEYEGVVTEMSLFHVHLDTERGEVLLPNQQVLAAGIGPGARSAQSDDKRDDGAD